MYLLYYTSKIVPSGGFMIGRHKSILLNTSMCYDLFIVCDTKMNGEFHIINTRCQVKHIGTCCENEFTELDQI